MPSIGRAAKLAWNVAEAPFIPVENYLFLRPNKEIAKDIAAAAGAYMLVGMISGAVQAQKKSQEYRVRPAPAAPTPEHAVTHLSELDVVSTEIELVLDQEK